MNSPDTPALRRQPEILDQPSRLTRPTQFTPIEVYAARHKLGNTQARPDITKTLVNRLKGVIATRGYNISRDIIPPDASRHLYGPVPQPSGGTENPILINRAP
jgi:hypothetical protein